MGPLISVYFQFHGLVYCHHPSEKKVQYQDIKIVAVQTLQPDLQ